MAKLKIALYWGAACGGCDVAVLDINEKVLDLAGMADIVFWPVAMDYKYADLEKIAPLDIDVTFFHGAVRNSENEHIARLFREKSKTLIAFGSCAVSGGIPALANFKKQGDILNKVYLDTPSTNNPEKIFPNQNYNIPAGDLKLPEFLDTVHSLDQVVDVDYYVPGCPPAVERIWDAVEAIASGNLPLPKNTVGAFDKSVCDECSREKNNKKLAQFHRVHEIIPDTGKCLLEQGLICMGPATRGGCGSKCINANMPCRGCYGPLAGVSDQGAKFISSLGSIIDAKWIEQVEEILGNLSDPAGHFYRFGMSKALLKGAIYND